jgi:HEPN domain-containing protein
VAGLFTSYSTSVEDLVAAREARLQEAKTLLDAGHYAGVILACYIAIEIALKIYICRSSSQDRLQKSYQTHDLRELLAAAGLSDCAIKGARNRRNQRGEAFFSSKAHPVATAKQNWDVILARSQDDIINLRYENPSKISRADAEGCYYALTLAPNGLILWLGRQA